VVVQHTATGYCDSDQQPVIAQNLYRLAGGRFEQIGMSWLKHGFLSTNSPNAACNPQQPCAGAPFGGDQLGVGCTDTYTGSLNGHRPAGMRSEVNATTGTFPFPLGGRCTARRRAAWQTATLGVASGLRTASRIEAVSPAAGSTLA
jgi:hypothetical protein